MSKRGRGAEVSNQADVARRGLVSVNRLDYTLQPDLSVAVARSSKKHFFQGSTYKPLTRAICVLNSGAEYIDPQNSYLRFEVTNDSGTAGQDLKLEAGSGINFIKQIILTSRSGDEIERIEQVNQLACQLDRYMHSNDWINSQGEVIGYLNADEATGALSSSSGYVGLYAADTRVVAGRKPATGTMVARTKTKTFVIPLSCITGLFRSFDRLLPPMLCSGMRIEIEWESSSEVGAYGIDSVAGVSYTISKPEIVMDQYQLTDSIMRVLNEESAMRGLEVVFSTWYNHEETYSAAATEYHVQVRKAVSRALGLLVKLGPPRGSIVGTTYKFVSAPADITSYQVRVGSLYFPQQAIANVKEKNSQELYHHTLRGLGKWRTPHATTGVPYKDYAGDLNRTDSSFQSIYTDFERSNTQKLTGLPINNSRVAEISITCAGSRIRRVNSYLHYVRLLRVFLQNVEVEE